MTAEVRQPRVGATRLARDLGKRLVRGGFELGQRAGVDLLPHHFYSSVPDMRALARTDTWRARRSLVGVAGAGDLDAQLAVLGDWLAVGPAVPAWPDACREHGEPGYGPIESDVLYAFIRARRPARIVQVGAGVSTAVILRAAREAGYRPQLTCVDPFPTRYLTERAHAGEVTLVSEPAQEVSSELLLGLGSGDLLFIDSTHTVKPGSEVNRIVFEVLPRLAAGVWVHVHDVTWPYDYSRGVLSDDLFFWGESTLVLAFLVGNARYTVRVCLSQLHYDRPAQLRALLAHYRPQPGRDGVRSSPDGHFPSALYLQTVS